MRSSIRMAASLGRVAGVLGLLGGCVGAPGPAPVAYVPTQQPVAPVAGGQSYQAATVAVPYGGTCYAGFYVCQLPQSLPIGSGCSCPGLGAPSYGSVR